MYGGKLFVIEDVGIRSSGDEQIDHSTPILRSGVMKGSPPIFLDIIDVYPGLSQKQGYDGFMTPFSSNVQWRAPASLILSFDICPSSDEKLDNPPVTLPSGVMQRGPFVDLNVVDIDLRLSEKKLQDTGVAIPSSHMYGREFFVIACEDVCSLSDEKRGSSRMALPSSVVQGGPTFILYLIDFDSRLCEKKLCNVCVSVSSGKHFHDAYVAVARSDMERRELCVISSIGRRPSSYKECSDPTMPPPSGVMQRRPSVVLKVVNRDSWLRKQ
ncbi:hypothetical protein EV122DRAFT_253196 [Schizophyllum commune]